MLTLFQKPSILILILLLLSGCSSRKNTRYTRWYQGFTTYYNGYYHAEKKYKEQIVAINNRVAIPAEKSFAELYFVLAPGGLLIEEGDVDVFAEVVKRCDVMIAKHSISKPPRRDRRKQSDVNYQYFLRRKEFNPTMNRIWLLKQKALLLSGDIDDAITAGRTIEQVFAHDTTTLTNSRIISAVAYSLKGWIYAANNLLEPLQYRPDATFVSEMLSNHLSYYLQRLERLAINNTQLYLPTNHYNQPILTDSVTNFRQSESFLVEKNTRIKENEKDSVNSEKPTVDNTISEFRLILYPKTSVISNESLLYEVNKIAVKYHRSRALSVTHEMSNQISVVTIYPFFSRKEAVDLLTVLLSQCAAFIPKGDIAVEAKQIIPCVD